jgi:hypothetical protein
MDLQRNWMLSFQVLVQSNTRSCRHAAPAAPGRNRLVSGTLVSRWDSFKGEMWTKSLIGMWPNEHVTVPSLTGKVCQDLDMARHPHALKSIHNAVS